MPIKYVSLKDQRSLVHKVSLQGVLLNGPSVMIPLPDPAAGLTVQMQRGEPVLWYLFYAEDAATIRDREIICVGTGIPFRSDIQTYLGTIQIEDLVHHYFLVGK